MALYLPVLSVHDERETGERLATLHLTQCNAMVQNPHSISNRTF